MYSNVAVYQQSMEDTNKDDLFVCPYDPVHRISGKRFVRHILKCRKNHPGADMVTCPFNARHIMKKPELQLHLMSCPDRAMLERELDCERRNGMTGDNSVPEYSTEELDFGDEYESWDQEVEEEENSERRGKYQLDNIRNIRYEQILEHRREQQMRQQQTSLYGDDQENAPTQPGPLVVNCKLPTTRPNVMNGVVGIGMGRGRGRVGCAPTMPPQPPKTTPKRPSYLAANFPTYNNLNNSSQFGERMERSPAYKAVEIQPKKPQNLSAINQQVQELKAKQEEKQRKLAREEALNKEKKKFLKLLKQIEALEVSKNEGKMLDKDQMEKISRKDQIESRLDGIAEELNDF